MITRLYWFFVWLYHELRIVGLVPILLLAAVGAHAQELPFKPEPNVRVQLTCPTDACAQFYSIKVHGKFYEELPVRKRTADRAWFVSTALSGILTVADVQNSVYALRGGSVREVNPLLGSHPSVARYYALCGPVALLTGYVAWRWKREDQALADAGLIGHKYAKWHVANDLNSAAHVVGLAVTLLSTHR
jgi:hypothetical protein